MKLTRADIATFIAILFHLCGWIGIAFTPYKDWFIANTPFNLCLMVALIIWNQTMSGRFFIFIIICCIAGLSVEIIGVNTARLFGHYQYGNALGTQFNGVPWLIGINWFLIIFCSGSCMQQFHRWLIKKTSGSGMDMSPGLMKASLIIDSALLAVFFDWIMEPAAMKLGFWSWQNATIPLYNYVCWFLISLVLLVLFRKLLPQTVNLFAVHLFIIQLLFFLAIRTPVS